MVSFIYFSMGLEQGTVLVLKKKRVKQTVNLVAENALRGTVDLCFVSHHLFFNHTHLVLPDLSLVMPVP